LQVFALVAGVEQDVLPFDIAEIAESLPEKAPVGGASAVAETAAR